MWVRVWVWAWVELTRVGVHVYLCAWGGNGQWVVFRHILKPKLAYTHGHKHLRRIVGRSAHPRQEGETAAGQRGCSKAGEADGRCRSRQRCSAQVQAVGRCVCAHTFSIDGYSHSSFVSIPLLFFFFPSRKPHPPTTLFF